MKKDRNRHFLSILSQSNPADLQGEMNPETPEVAARRRLDRWIEQVLSIPVQAAAIESKTIEVSNLAGCELAPLGLAAEERLEPSVDFYKPWEHEAPAA